MSRRKPMPGWGERVRAVRERLNHTRSTFADMFGVADSTVRSWEDDDAATDPATIKRGVAAAGIPDGPSFLWWLADGQGEPPYWLDGEPGSPIPPEGPNGFVAMPREVLDAGRAAFKILDGARAVGELREEPSIEAWRVLKSFREALPNPSPDTRQDSPFVLTLLPTINSDNILRRIGSRDTYAPCSKSGECSRIIKLDDSQDRLPIAKTA